MQQTEHTSPKLLECTLAKKKQIVAHLTQTLGDLTADLEQSGFVTPHKPLLRETPVTPFGPIGAAVSLPDLCAAAAADLARDEAARHKFKKLRSVSKTLNFEGDTGEIAASAMTTKVIQSTTKTVGDSSDKVSDQIRDKSDWSASLSEPGTPLSGREDRALKRAQVQAQQRLDDEKERRDIQDEEMLEASAKQYETLPHWAQNYFTRQRLLEVHYITAIMHQNYENPNLLLLPKYDADPVYREVSDEVGMRGNSALTNTLNVSLGDVRNCKAQLCEDLRLPASSKEYLDFCQFQPLYEKLIYLLKRVLFLAHFLRLRLYGSADAEDKVIRGHLKEPWKTAMHCTELVINTCQFKDWTKKHVKKPGVRLGSKEDPPTSSNIISRSGEQHSENTANLVAPLPSSSKSLPAVSLHVKSGHAKKKSVPKDPPKDPAGDDDDDEDSQASDNERNNDQDGRDKRGGGGGGGRGNGGKGRKDRGGGGGDDSPDDSSDDDDEDGSDEDQDYDPPEAEGIGGRFFRQAPQLPMPNGANAANYPIVLNPLSHVSFSDLPVFSNTKKEGHVDFDSWWSCLEALIPRLRLSLWSDSRCLALLKSRLAGEPLGWVSRLRPQPGKYIFNEALSRLYENFGRGSMDIFVTYKAAMNCPRAKDNVESMVAVVQTLTQLYDLIHQQGISTKNMATVYFMIYTSTLCNHTLTKTLLRTWQAKSDPAHVLGSSTQPKEVIDALAKEVRLRQGISKVQKEITSKPATSANSNSGSKNNNSGNNRRNNNNNGSRNNRSSSLPQGFQTHANPAPPPAPPKQSYNTGGGGGGGGGGNRAPPKCPLQECSINKPHPLWSCFAFKKMPVGQRIQLVEKSHRCRVCLKASPGHSSKDCPSRDCTKCGKRHHTLVHQDRGQPQTPGQNRSSGQQQQRGNSYQRQNFHTVSVPSYNAAMNCDLPVQISFKAMPDDVGSSGQPVSILMAVNAWVYPSGTRDESRRIKARILLDTGSDISLIRRDDAKIMKLSPVGKPNSIPLQISCSTGKITPKTLETSHVVDIYALDHSGSLKNVKCLTVKEIGVPLAPLNFKKEDFAHLKPFDFGEDIPTTSPRTINMMLSAAYLMEIMNKAPTKGRPGEPTVCQTSIGPALTGRQV